MSYNIPNIFIKEINLFDHSNEQMTINVITMISDVEGQKSWSTGLASKNMYVLTVISSNSNLNDDITSGRIVFDKDLLQKQYMEDPAVKIMVRPAKSLNQVKDNGETIFLDTYSAMFSKNEGEIKVFSSLYLELSEFIEQNDLILAGPVRKYGAIASDTIIEFGNVNAITTIFVTRDGQQYRGPVHFHPTKGYMAGAQHSSGKHAELEERQISNFKIKDFRKKHYSIPSSIGEQKTSTYSNLNYSVNSRGNVTGVFSINIKNIILYNTNYGFLLRKLSEQAIAENISKLKIKTLSITRKRTDVHEEATIVIGAASFTGGEVGGISLLPGNPLINDASSLSEIATNESNIRTFQFTDKTLHKNSLGKYQYHITVAFTDPTVNFVTELLESLRESERQIKFYYNMLDTNKNYDYKLDRTKQRLFTTQLQSIASIEELSTSSWIVANHTYMKAVSYLYNLTEVEKLHLTDSISSKTDPQAATVFSLRHFLEDYTNLVEKCNSFFDFSNTNIQADSIKKFVTTPNSRNVVFLEHLFKQSVVLSNYVISYDYMKLDNDNGVLIINKETFEQRAKEEHNKFFLSAPSDNLASFAPEGYEALLNLERNYYSYLSPSEMVAGHEKTNLSDISKIKLKDINKIFRSSYDRNIYNIGRYKKTDSEEVSDEMSHSDFNPQEEG